MTVIWYLMSCQGKAEEEVISFCRNHLQLSELKNVFSLKYQKFLKYQGKWNLEERTVFPGYVIIEVEENSAIEIYVKYYMAAKRKRMGV